MKTRTLPSQDLALQLRACCVQSDTGGVQTDWTIGQFLGETFKPKSANAVQQQLIKNVRTHWSDIAETLKVAQYSGQARDEDNAYELIYVLVRLWQHERHLMDD